MLSGLSSPVAKGDSTAGGYSNPKELYERLLANG